MLDTETKRRIDTARDILVGKVPDPKSQVEQITIALIYKFMDDMDAQSEELGGKRKFFTGKFAQYGWPKLMHSGLGGHEVLALYAEAISTMPANPGIPPLFREIFKNAYLPYRDPETLKSFLRIIDGFTYDHSERLGDAFEYLLSVLGSQGDAGQFRTPRHIIDFIVSIVDPKKGEVILDPACGTAGFLISAYKHILKASQDEKKQLTPDERLRLAKNLKGYDISPDMVRLSLVNLYLHGFTNPNVLEYDTLTSEEHWNDYADVILANPPFMSPKGGIRPHKRFSIDAKRSEVLFVDYIAEHLTPNGRAGIIVPEGIIFQSGTAYKQLRKMLVDSYLVAVISLPAGVFNPYSGVKTSILILDKSLAKQSDTVGFFKIENDGFGLGAQRREIEKNDIPQVRAELENYVAYLRTGKELETPKTSIALIVARSKLAANGDYSLSGDRYREGAVQPLFFPWRSIETLVETITPPTKIQKTDFAAMGRFPIIDQSQDEIAGWTNDETSLVHADKPLIIFGDHTCAIKYLDVPFAQGADGIKILRVNDELIPRYLFQVLRARPLESSGYQRHFSKLKEFEIPLPPLDIQAEIVAEIEGYQKVINGARAVLDNYRPHVPIHPEWPLVTLDAACEIQRGKFSHRPRNEPRFYGGKYPFIQTGDIVRADGRKITHTQTLNEDGLSVSKLFKPPIVVITIAANIGDTAVLDFPSCFPDSVVGLTPKDGTDVHYLELAMRTKKQYLNDIAPQAAQKNINIEILRTVEIPLPPLATQQAIVAEVEAEQALVTANRELIARFERKIQATLARIWATSPTRRLLSG